METSPVGSERGQVLSSPSFDILPIVLFNIPRILPVILLLPISAHPYFPSRDFGYNVSSIKWKYENFPSRKVGRGFMSISPVSVDSVHHVHQLSFMCKITGFFVKKMYSSCL